MKKVIFVVLIASQVNLVPSVFAENESVSDNFLVDAEGNVNLGGLLQVDKDGKVDMNVGENSINVDEGDVQLSTSDLGLDVEGGNVDLGAGENDINVNGGDVHLSTSNLNLGVNERNVDLGVNETSINVESADVHLSEQIQALQKQRVAISDGVFFDNDGKAIKLNSSEFSRLEFANINMLNQNFKDADFSWSTISNVDFSGSDLSGADFSRTTLNNVTFNGVDLTSTDLSWATFTNVDFSNATIVGSNLERTNLTNIDFTNAVVQGSCFDRNEFVNVKMINVDLTDSVFEDYDFSDVDFSGTNKGVAVWDADECQSIANYTQRVKTAGGQENITQQETQREELIQASSIVQKLSEGKGTSIDLTVNFQTNSDQLHGNAHAQVTEIAKALSSDALKSVKVMIEGHTDSEGADDYNVDLSYRRASTVQRVLVKDYDVNLALLSIKGYGEDRPIASNDTATGRGLNRRVTLVRQ